MSLITQYPKFKVEHLEDVINQSALAVDGRGVMSCSQWAEVEYNSNFYYENLLTEGTSRPRFKGEGEVVKDQSLQIGHNVLLSARSIGGVIKISQEKMNRQADTDSAMNEIIENLGFEQLLAFYEIMDEDSHRMLNEIEIGSTKESQAPDGQPIVSESHQYKSGLTFSNKMSVAGTQMSLNQIKAAISVGGRVVDPMGYRNPMTYDKLVVKKGSSAMHDAMSALGMENYRPSTRDDVNSYIVSRYGMEVVETKYMDSDTAYMFMDSSKGSPFFVRIAKRPSVVGSTFNTSTQELEISMNAEVIVGLIKMPHNILYDQGSST